jgi:hypothetical protein
MGFATGGDFLIRCMAVKFQGRSIYYRGTWRRLVKMG